MTAGLQSVYLPVGYHAKSFYRSRRSLTERVVLTEGLQSAYLPMGYLQEQNKTKIYRLDG